MIEKAKVKKQYAKIKARQQRLAEQQGKPAGPPPILPAASKEEPEAEAEDSSPETGTWTEPPPDGAGGNPHPTPAETEIHPDRQAMLDDGDPDIDNRDRHIPARDLNPTTNRPRKTRRRAGPGGYTYEKQVAEAARKKQEAEERARERERREAERNRRMAERERHRKQLVKARTPGKDGRRKLGRESVVLLDRVKRLVGEGS